MQEPKEEFIEVEALEDPIELQKGDVLHGQIFDYVIQTKLGQGSFGITYLVNARKKGTSNGGNLLMVVKEFFMDAINSRNGSSVVTGSNNSLFNKYKDKFVKESLKLAKVKHPNIIKVTENFQQNNTEYYSMEFIPGGSLDSLIKRKGKLSQESTIFYAKQICSALEFMHSDGLLHLDLKPLNILLDGSKIVLIDFGLSKQYDEDGNPESSTNIGGGTRGYAPLEQANYRRGEGLPVTMDIYALGATMYKMLTSQAPPEASILLNEGFPEDEFANTDCSLDLLRIIKKCMAPLKNDRFQSVQEVDNELARIQREIERKKKEEQERLRREEEERKKKEEQDRLRKEEEERKRQERLRAEEEAKKTWEQRHAERGEEILMRYVSAPEGEEKEIAKQELKAWHREAEERKEWERMKKLLKEKAERTSIGVESNSSKTNSNQKQKKINWNFIFRSIFPPLIGFMERLKNNLVNFMPLPV